MSSVSDTVPDGAWRRRGGCGRSQWTPVELLATVLGFMVFWPIGLGLIAWKMCQRNGGPASNWFGALGQKFGGFNPAAFGQTTRSDWRGFGFGQSGNVAFDEWRKQEIERLEAERSKLEAAQKEFEAFVEQARRARDREEFERFMRDRTPSSP